MQPHLTCNFVHLLCALLALPPPSLLLLLLLLRSS
jgi:hypothetical protein